MPLIPTAFVPSISLGSTRPTLFLNTCKVQQRKALRASERKAPTMVSPASVATELIAAGALGYGTYYFFFRDEKSSEEPATAAEEQPPAEQVQKGIIGLSPSPPSNEVSKPSIPTPLESFPITPPPPDTIGVNIDDYLDSADASPTSHSQRRLEEELSFASDSLSDLSDCDGAVVVDHAGDAVWATGELVGDTVTLGTLLTRVRDTREPETLNVDNNFSVPFLKPEVRSVAAMPIGETGATLVVASRHQDFFGEVEKRVADAVCARLAHFLTTPPSVGA